MTCAWRGLGATVVLVVAATTAQARPLDDADRAPPVAAAARPPSGSLTPVGAPYEPPPHLARGLTEGSPDGADPYRLVRIALAPVRCAWQGVMAIPRGALRAEATWRLSARAKDLLFDDTGRFGVYPTAFIETGIGANVGARAQAMDLFRRGISVRARLGYGGAHQQVVAGRVTTGRWLGPVEVELGVKAERYPGLRFWGVGNADARAAPGPGEPRLDPLGRDGAAAESAYRLDELRGELAAIVALSARARARASVVHRDRRFRDDPDGDTPRLVDVYDAARVPGFARRERNVYGELELVWDGRRATSAAPSRAAPSRGWRLAGWLGWQRSLGEDVPARHGHARWGADVQRYLDLHAGDRVMVARVVIEGVTGAIEDVPFSDLPRLGGPTWLRGYPRDRFRDRRMALASLEYRWPVEHGLTGFVFVDAGRVWRTLDAAVDDGAEAVRVGAGGGLQLHAGDAFVARLQVASSVDGGVLTTLSFEAPFDTRPRGVTR